MQKTPTIGIIGGTVWGNRGAESMLVTTIGMIRAKHPGARFNVYSYYPAHDRLLVKEIDYVTVFSSKPQSLVLRHFPFAMLAGLFRLIGIRLPDALLPNLVRELRRCDVLLDVGGVTFMDDRLLFLPFNILTIYPAMLVGVPVVKLSQALGPFKKPLNIMISRFFLSRCERIFARGAITASLLQGLGLKNCSPAADIAFLYKPEFSLSKENEELADQLEASLAGLKKAGKRIVAISPSSLVYQKAQAGENNYSDFILDLVRKLDAPDMHFLFIPNSTTQGSEKLRNNDIVIVKALHKLADDRLEKPLLDKMEWVEYDLNTRSLRRLMAHCNMVMTSRFHAMISGLSLCIPTLVIGWSHKYEEALAGLKMERYAADFSTIDTRLVDLARELLKDEEKIRIQLAEGLQQARVSSTRQFEYLEKFLN